MNSVTKVIAGCLPQKELVVGLSGGMDSVVLLHVLVQLQLPRVRAVHVDHGLSVHANEWVEFCQRLCDQWQVPLEVVYVDVPQGQGMSLEASARECRYSAFADVMNSDNALLTAHHADDQAETVLLQLLRGGGLAGLAAMPELAGFASGLHVRPCLSLSRAQLLTYATQHELTWIEDDSNANLAFDRNYLRQKVMPLLQARWPGMLKTMQRSARHCALGLTIQEHYLAKLLVPGTKTNTLSVWALKTHELNFQKLLIHYWCKSRNLALPSDKQLNSIYTTLVSPEHSKLGVVQWSKIEARRHQDNLYIFENQTYDLDPSYEWDLKQDLVLPHMTIKPDKVPLPGPVTIRFRQGGERIHLPNSVGSHPLKKHLHECGVPPWERDRVPLVYKDGQLVMIVTTE